MQISEPEYIFSRLNPLFQAPQTEIDLETRVLLCSTTRTSYRSIAQLHATYTVFETVQSNLGYTIWSVAAVVTVS